MSYEDGGRSDDGLVGRGRQLAESITGGVGRLQESSRGRMIWAFLLLISSVLLGHLLMTIWNVPGVGPWALAGVFGKLFGGAASSGVAIILGVYVGWVVLFANIEPRREFALYFGGTVLLIALFGAVWEGVALDVPTNPAENLIAFAGGVTFVVVSELVDYQNMSLDERWLDADIELWNVTVSEHGEPLEPSPSPTLFFLVTVVLALYTLLVDTAVVLATVLLGDSLGGAFTLSPGIYVAHISAASILLLLLRNFYIDGYHRQPEQVAFVGQAQTGKTYTFIGLFQEVAGFENRVNLKGELEDYVDEHETEIQDAVEENRQPKWKVNATESDRTPDVGINFKTTRPNPRKVELSSTDYAGEHLEQAIEILERIDQKTAASPRELIDQDWTVDELQRVDKRVRSRSTANRDEEWSTEQLRRIAAESEPSENDRGLLARVLWGTANEEKTLEQPDGGQTVADGDALDGGSDTLFEDIPDTVFTAAIELASADTLVFMIDCTAYFGNFEYSDQQDSEKRFKPILLQNAGELFGWENIIIVATKADTALVELADDFDRSSPARLGVPECDYSYDDLSTDLRDQFEDDSYNIIKNVIGNVPQRSVIPVFFATEPAEDGDGRRIEIRDAEEEDTVQTNGFDRLIREVTGGQ